jgi:hypothetical protein
LRFRPALSGPDGKERKKNKLERSRKEKITPADIAALIAYSTEEGKMKGWR